MFSTRTGWDLRSSPWAQAVERHRREDRPLVDLTETNPTRCGFKYPWQSFAALGDGRGGLYLPDPRGTLAAREALGRFLRCEPDSLLLSASTSEAYGWLFKLLCDPGDNVVVFVPGYPLLEDLARLEGVELRQVPLLPETGFAIDPAEVAATFDARTRAVVVVNPANPTGQFLSSAELAALDSLCAQRGCALIVDEVFADYARGTDPGRVPTVRGHTLQALTFALSGLSKVAALPQFKLGWTWVGGPEGLRAGALGRLEHLADCYLSVGTPVQIALPVILEHGVGIQAQLRERIDSNLATLQRLNGPTSAWTLLASSGGWSAVLRVPSSPDEETLCLLLLEAGVLVQPGYFFDFPRPGYLVLSLLPEPEAFERGVRLLAGVVDRLSAGG